MIGLLFSIIVNNRLADRVEKLGDTLNAKIDRQTENVNAKIDRQTESFNDQVTVLLSTIHTVDVRVVKLGERDK